MNEFCRRFGLETPILNAGMGGGIAGVELAAAVIEAGGGGVLGLGALPRDAARDAIRALRARTRRAFGVNQILPMQQPGAIDACLEERVPWLILFWGDPAPYVADARRRGVALFAQVGDAAEAEAAAAAGVDGIFVQGREAGGHVKATRPLAETLADTVRAVHPLPVIASGGIADGTQIARALAAGASAVSLGTRYLVTPEARVVPEYKDRVLAAKAADTVLTQLFDVGWPDANHRVLRNGAYREWEAAGEPRSGARPGEGKTVARVTIANETEELPRYTVMPPVSGFEGDLEEVPLYAGESCEWVDRSLPAGELTRQLDREWRAAAER